MSKIISEWDSLLPSNQKALPREIIIQDMFSAGPLLRRKRERKQLSVAAIANSIGVARETIYRLERGDNVTAKTLFDYCVAVGVSMQFRF